MNGTLLQRISLRCIHEFSWPRRSAEGDYYQICLHCGARYAYDWTAMRRTDRLKESVAPPRSTVAVSRGHRWRPRERRIKSEVSVLYRTEANAEWANGTSVNISRSGVLVRMAQRLEPGSWVEFILDMPEEIAVPGQSHLLCRGSVARNAPGISPEEWLVAFAIGDYEFLDDNYPVI